MEAVRAAVFGVGAIGQHHARVYHELEGVTLAAVADPSAERRAAAERRFGVRAYADHEALLAAERIDLASVAVPSIYHHDVAIAAMARGVSVLVEKPIAATVEQGRALIGAARSAGVVLTVGHVERFNPAVVALKERLDAGQLGHLFQLIGRRLSPFPSYVRDVGVVIDLATHELDIFNHVLGETPARIYAETGRHVHERYEDMLVASLRYPSGTLGVLDINWLTPNKVRELRVTGEGGMFVVDYLNQDLTFYENSSGPSQWDAMALFKGVEEGNVIKIRVAKTEPLKAELAAFVATVATGGQPRVSGEDGLAALIQAQLVLASAAAGEALDVAAALRARGWG